MNSINFSPFTASSQNGFLLDAALGRLGKWIDEEISSLEDLLDISDCQDAIDDIVALKVLHLEADCTPADLRRLLGDASASIERLTEYVWKIASEECLDVRAPSYFDAWVRWSGARLEDISHTLSRALEA